MTFSISASEDRTTYTVVNNKTNQTAQMVYDFDAGTATVSGDFYLIPFGINGFPLPTDVSLDAIAPMFTGFIVSSSLTLPDNVIEMDESVGEGLKAVVFTNWPDIELPLNCGSFDFPAARIIELMPIPGWDIDIKPIASFELDQNAPFYEFLLDSPADYIVEEGGEFPEIRYTFSDDGLTAQCEFPGDNPLLSNVMHIKLSSEHGNVPAYVEVPCFCDPDTDFVRTYTFSSDIFPTPSKDGWVFGGWFTDDTFQTRAVEGQSYTATKLFAKWTKAPVLVAEHRKDQDGFYAPVYRQTIARLVQTDDGRNLQDALDTLTVLADAQPADQPVGGLWFKPVK